MVTLLYNLAVDYSKLDNYSKQGEAAAEAIKKGTKFAGEAYVLLGDSLQKEGKIDEAVAQYKRAKNVKPDILDIYLKLSDVYRSRKNFKEAIDIVKEGIKLFPDNGVLHTRLSGYYSLTDRNFDAIISAKKAIELLPNAPEAYLNVCRSYHDTKQYPQAIEACAEVLKMQPNNGEANFYTARAYDFTNKRDTATPYYEKAVTDLMNFTNENPTNEYGFYLLGGAFFAVNKFSDSIEAYKKYLETNPQSSRTIYNLAVAYFRNDQKDLAAALIIIFCLKPTNPSPKN